MGAREATDPALETAIAARGRALWERTLGQTPGLFNRHFWIGQLLDRAMRDAAFRTDLFLLVDVLPTLRSGRDVAGHLSEYLLKDGRVLPAPMGAALRAAALGPLAPVAAPLIRRGVAQMARRFIVGDDVRGALHGLRRLRRAGIAATVDLLGEATLSEVEADTFAARYLALIDALAAEAAQWAPDPVLDADNQGPIPRANVSLKISALEPHLNPADLAGSVARAARRVLPLVRHARERDVFVNFDMEQWDLHGITLDLLEAVALDPVLRDWPHLGIAIQAYLRTAEGDIERLEALARRRGAPLTVRLVKGAYWDYEVAHAAQHGFACPVHIGKAATDASFERCTRLLLERRDLLRPAIASHNLRSLTHALVLAERMGAPPAAMEIQMLHGMAEPERTALRAAGHRLRVYAPVGALLPGMAYLVRRLLENTANQGFLRLSYHEGVDIDQLLKNPSTGLDRSLLLENKKFGCSGFSR